MGNGKWKVENGKWGLRLRRRAIRHSAVASTAHSLALARSARGRLRRGYYP